jgi:hypothetical protein
MALEQTLSKGAKTLVTTDQATVDYLVSEGWVVDSTTGFEPPATQQGLDARLKIDRVALGAGLVGGDIRRVNAGATATSPFTLEWSPMSFVGLPRSIYPTGFVDCYQPASGVTVHGHGGAPDRVTSSTGVPVAPWETLYYEPPAAGGVSVAANWHLVDHASDFDIPTTWLPIVTRSGFGATTSGSAYYDEVRWADGRHETCWLSMTYLNTWHSYNTPALPTNYGGGQFRRLNGSVFFRGLIQSDVNYVGSASITVLPPGFRPGVIELFNMAANAGVMRVDVLGDGTVMTNGAQAQAPTTNAPGWVSLNGISFPADA